LIALIINVCPSLQQSQINRSPHHSARMAAIQQTSSVYYKDLVQICSSTTRSGNDGRLKRSPKTKSPQKLNAPANPRLSKNPEQIPALRCQ
jgi:hypothetical protein